MDSLKARVLAAESLSTQVGGHEGVLETEDGSLIIKPALPIEHQFYQKLQHTPELASLRAFTPKFIGTLRLEGQLEMAKNGTDGRIDCKPIDVPEKECLVLENLSHTFLKPNILDVKLGTVLHDRFAPPEKVQRMSKSAQETTSLETGIRLTGFQVYDNNTGKVVVTPKAYGKFIKSSELHDGIERFFPINESLEEFPNTKSAHGLPRSTLLPILHHIRDELFKIMTAYSEHEIRMVGGSLLIIYEADWDRASRSLEHITVDSEVEDDEDVSDLGVDEFSCSWRRSR